MTGKSRGAEYFLYQSHSTWQRGNFPPDTHYDNLTMDGGLHDAVVEKGFWKGRLS